MILSNNITDKMAGMENRIKNNDSISVVMRYLFSRDTVVPIIT